MKVFTLDREQRVPRPRSEVFAFFADATNLERITPEFLRFRVTTPQPIEIRTGTLIDYKLGLFGIPFRWRTLIETFEPETRFIDRQLKGPYALWLHTHTFEDAPGGGTLMKDHLEYAIPLGPLGTIARVLFVRRTVEAIFDYRREAIARLFPAR